MDDWVPVPGFPMYSVNRLGQVRKDSNHRLLKPKVNQYGVAFVGMQRDRMKYQRGLARIVAQCFLPATNEFFDTPINLDGDRMNCAADNLAWRPRWFAVLYNRQFQHQYENPIMQEIVDLDSGDRYPDSFSVCPVFGLLERDVVLSILNRTYTWPTYQRFALAA